MRTALGVLVSVCSLSLLHAAGIPAAGSEKQSDRVSVAPDPSLPDHTEDVRTAWVARIGMGLIPSKVKALSAAPCPDGGIVISGTYLSKPLTGKLGANGETVWADVFVDPDKLEAETAGVYVDSSGNTYTVLRSRKRFDYLPWTVVIKCDASGRRAWATAHPGLHKASAVDADGNVTLALYWNSPAMVNLGSPGYAVVRISSDGQIKWRSTADGTWGSGSDIRSVDLDGAGNVYVTGLRLRYKDPTSVSTVSFDAGGSMRWGNSHGFPDDRSAGACFASVDPSGAVVVIAAEAGTPYFELVRFDPAGIKKAVHPFTGTPRALLRERSGDLFLVTETDLQRMDTSGVVKWKQSRDSAVVFCSSWGSLFTGRTVNGQMSIASYDSTGTRVWSVRPAPVAEGSDELVTLVPDAAGNVTATGTFSRKDGGADFVGHRVNRQGAVERILRYAAPPESNEYVQASCVDRSGNTYLVGTQYFSSTPTVVFFAKVDPAGNTVFMRQLTEVEAKDLVPFGMTVDRKGKVRIAGVNKTSTVLLCFSDRGTLEWGSPGMLIPGSTDAGMKTDSVGNTILYGGYFDQRVLIISFNAAGNVVWSRTHAGARYQNVTCGDIDASGNVLFGTTQGLTDNALVGFLVKYAPDGRQLWSVTSGESMVQVQGQGYQRFKGLAVDSQGRTIVVLENWRASDNTTSLILLCYSPAGELLWWGDDLRGRRTTLRTLLVGKHDDVIMGGTADGNRQFLLRYDSQGKNLSHVEPVVRCFPELGVVDANGNICLTGSLGGYTVGEDPDIVTMSYGPSGGLAWVERFNSSRGASDYSVGIGAGPDGTVISAGYSVVTVQDGPPQATGKFVTVVGYAPLAAPGSLVANAGFESELRSWVCNTNGAATIDVVSAGEKSPLAARITVDRPDSGIVLYQPDITLEPSAHYRLTFSARCNTGHDIAVSLIKHAQSFMSYGLQEKVCDLGREWTSFSIDFSSEGFAGYVVDGRIMFQFNGLAEAGDEYMLDNIVLERIPPPDAASEVRHPADVRCGTGKSVRLRVDAPQAIAFRWEKNGEIIPGADKNSYATPVLSASDSGSEYTCLVTGPTGTLQTRSAILRVRNERVSLVPNWRFEDEAQGWTMAAGAPASLVAEGTPAVAHVSVQNDDPGLWLMTKGIELIGGVEYRLSFRARSSTGHDLGVSIFKHTAPYTAYAPGVEECDLTPQWQEFTMTFTPLAGIGVVADARLMFWMTPFAVAGDEYFFDAIMLEEVVPDPSVPTGAESELPPPVFALEQNSPNPFNPETSISFVLVTRQHVRLVVYDLLGREVARLLDGPGDAGYHTVHFRANGIASGVYIYRLETPEQVLTKKMILLR